ARGVGEGGKGRGPRPTGTGYLPRRKHRAVGREAQSTDREKPQAETTDEGGCPGCWIHNEEKGNPPASPGVHDARTGIHGKTWDDPCSHRPHKCAHSRGLVDGEQPASNRFGSKQRAAARSCPQFSSEASPQADK